MVNLHTTPTDLQKITKIVVRAASLLNLEQTLSSSRIDLSMDLCACHVNGCPLDLDGLLESKPGDFVHDIAGISGHIDRATGQLQDGFTPRYAAHQHA